MSLKKRALKSIALALGQVQYRTDWSFVASTGDRYGTYTYLSTPQ